MFYSVYIGLTVHPVVSFHTHANPPPGIDYTVGSEWVPVAIFTDIDPERIAAAVNETLVFLRIEGDAPQIRFLGVGHKGQIGQRIQRFFGVAIPDLEVQVRSAGAACVATQRDLLAPLYRELPFLRIKGYLKTFLLILLLLDPVGNPFGETVQVGIYAGMACGRVIYIECQSKSSG